MPDSFIRPRQRALTSMSPHAGNPGVIVPARHFARTRMLAGLGAIDKSGYSSPDLFTFGAMEPLDAFGRGITQVSHDVSDGIIEVVYDQSQAGELSEDFWNSVTFQGIDKEWDGFTLLRQDNILFDNTGATFALWNFARDVPFLDGDPYLMTWRR